MAQESEKVRVDHTKSCKLFFFKKKRKKMNEVDIFLPPNPQNTHLANQQKQDHH